MNDNPFTLNLNSLDYLQRHLYHRAGLKDNTIYYGCIDDIEGLFIGPMFPMHYPNSLTQKTWIREEPRSLTVRLQIYNSILRSLKELHDG